jgi:hypothetical protein
MLFTSSLRLAAVALALLPAAFAAPTSLKIRNLEATDVVPNSYIVVYHQDTSAEAIAAHEFSIASSLNKRSSTLSGIGATYSMSEFKGYQIEADEDTIAEISNSPEVWTG